MKATFKDAREYLRLALRTYVSAHRVLDKYLACKMLVISTVMATDVLLSHYMTQLGSLTPMYHGQTMNGQEKVTFSQSSYWARVKDLERLEATVPRIAETYSFSKSLKRLLEEILPIEGEGGVRQLLGINFKELLNIAQFYILQTLKLLSENANWEFDDTNQLE